VVDPAGAAAARAAAGAASVVALTSRKRDLHSIP
jgi:hypothetical protein